VSRTEGLEEDAVWEHGDRWAVGESPRAIVGRGDLMPSHLADIRANGHALVAMPSEPPPRHANLTGWPPPTAKEVGRSLAMQLAAKATPIVRS
jgi:hypothetical protein